MSEFDPDPVISFGEAAQLVPGGVHRATISRWATIGVSGIRLAFLRRGGRMLTTVGSLATFLERCHEKRWHGISDAISDAAEKEMIKTTLLNALKTKIEQSRMDGQNS